MPRDRDEDGRFQKEYADEEFIEAIDSLDVAGTSNIAEEVGCSYNLAYIRLHELKEEDILDRESIGPSFVWKLKK